MVAHLTSLTLRRLAPAEVGRLVTHVVGDKAFPPAVLQEVVRKTDGVPLFVEELTKTVLASGLLEEQEERYALHGPLPPLAIPATLHDALLARLDRLAAAKVVAQLGATIGRTFAYDVVQAVAPLDAATLQVALAQLVEAEVVTQRGLPPLATYTFKHALMQDAAYESLLRSTRQQYHQRIAQVLAERFPETAEVQPEVVAQHYTAAGLHAKALSYWQRAGQHALDRSAYREAVASLERALESCLASAGESCHARAGHRSPTRPAYGALSVWRLGAYPGVSARGRDARRVPRRPASVGPGLALSVSPFPLHGCAMTRLLLPLSAPWRSLLASGDVVLHALANQHLGLAYPAQGDYRRAIDCLRQTVVSLDGVRRRERFGQLPARRELPCLACPVSCRAGHVR